MKNFVVLFFVFAFVILNRIDTKAAVLSCHTVMQSQSIFAVSLEDLGILNRGKTRLKSLKAMVLPKLGLPSFKGERYDISLVGNVKNATVAPAILLNRIRAVSDQYFAAAEAMGLPPRHRTHFVVEISPGGLGNKDGEIGMFPRDLDDIGPFTAHQGIGLMIEGLWGSRRLLSSKDMSHIVVIPLDDLGGTRINKPVIGHEVGHDMLQFTNPSLNEATADYISFLFSDEPHFEATKPLELTHVDSEGNKSKYSSHRFRSLSEPRIRNLSQMMPAVDRYHANSEILSHILWRIDQKYGKGTSLELLKYLETRNAEIPLVKEKEDEMSAEEAQELFGRFLLRSVKGGSENVSFFQSFKTILFSSSNSKGALGLIAEAMGRKQPEIKIDVDSQNLPEVKEALHRSFLEIGRLIRVWTQKNSQRVAPATIEQILREAGI